MNVDRIALSRDSATRIVDDTPGRRPTVARVIPNRRAVTADVGQREAEQLAAEIVRRFNAHDDLALMLAKLADAIETRRPEHEGYLQACAQEARHLLVTVRSVA